MAGLIEAATRVDIYGQGPSGLAGLALQQKLLRIGTVAPCWTDPHLALNSAALLTPGAVAIGISHSGTTVEVNQSLATARAAGATTIAVTNFPDSPLTGHADVVLTTTVRQMRWWSGIMSSRIAQLAVLDCLFAIVAQRRQERTGDLIARAEAAAVLRRTVSSPQPQPQP